MYSCRLLFCLHPIHWYWLFMPHLISIKYNNFDVYSFSFLWDTHKRRSRAHIFLMMLMLLLLMLPPSRTPKRQFKPTERFFYPSLKNKMRQYIPTQFHAKSYQSFIILLNCVRFVLDYFHSIFQKHEGCIYTFSYRTLFSFYFSVLLCRWYWIKSVFMQTSHSLESNIFFAPARLRHGFLRIKILISFLNPA